MPAFSRFAASVDVETAFTVLAVAKQLIASGKDVIELEIGDSPFSTPPKAIEAGVNAIRDGHSRYGPSQGIPEFRQAAAEYVKDEYGLAATAHHVVAGPGAKNFEQLFCEAFLNRGDGVLVFSPHFPTYPPNIARRDARISRGSFLTRQHPQRTPLGRSASHGSGTGPGQSGRGCDDAWAGE